MMHNCHVFACATSALYTIVANFCSNLTWAAPALLAGISSDCGRQRPMTALVYHAGAAKDLAGLPGVWAAVKYIHAMGPDELDLIREHSR